MSTFFSDYNKSICAAAAELFELLDPEEQKTKPLESVILTINSFFKNEYFEFCILNFVQSWDNLNEIIIFDLDNDHEGAFNYITKYAFPEKLLLDFKTIKVECLDTYFYTTLFSTQLYKFLRTKIFLLDKADIPVLSEEDLVRLNELKLKYK